MLVSIILNLNMTGGVTPTPTQVQYTPEIMKVEGGSSSHNFEEQRQQLLREDKEILIFVETILRECL